MKIQDIGRTWITGLAKSLRSFSTFILALIYQSWFVFFAKKNYVLFIVQGKYLRNTYENPGHRSDVDYRTC